MVMLLIAAAWGADCPSELSAEDAADERSSGRVILVVKDDRVLGVYEDDALVRCFSVQLGPGADDGPKTVRGDMRTPEGWYVVSHRNPRSRFYLSLGISYPNFDDVMRGVESGIITKKTGDTIAAAINAGTLPSQGTALGGNLFFHGTPAPYGGTDWTFGCVAVSNRDMDELYRLGVPGTAVRILPTLDEPKSAEP